MTFVAIAILTAVCIWQHFRISATQAAVAHMADTLTRYFKGER